MRARPSIGCALLALLACATSPPAPPARPAIEGDALILSIRDLVCDDCGGEIAAAAMKIAGVRDARFDEKTAELRLVVAPGTAADPIVLALDGMAVDGETIHIVAGGGKGAYAPFRALDPALDAREISATGEDVASLEGAASDGKVTVFDFSAEWCGPCHEVDRHMTALVARDPSVAYRRINVVSWDSPIAKHYLAKVEALPFAIILDPKKKEIARISGLDLGALDRAIAEGKTR